MGNTGALDGTVDVRSFSYSTLAPPFCIEDAFSSPGHAAGHVRPGDIPAILSLYFASTLQLASRTTKPVSTFAILERHAGHPSLEARVRNRDPCSCPPATRNHRGLTRGRARWPSCPDRLKKQEPATPAQSGGLPSPFVPAGILPFSALPPLETPGDRDEPLGPRSGPGGRRYGLEALHPGP